MLHCVSSASSEKKWHTENNRHKLCNYDLCDWSTMMIHTHIKIHYFLATVKGKSCLRVKLTLKKVNK